MKTPVWIGIIIVVGLATLYIGAYQGSSLTLPGVMEHIVEQGGFRYDGKLYAVIEVD